MEYSVFIRPLAIEDALVSYQWRNNPKIWRFTGSKPDKHITPEMETSWLTEVLKRKNEARFAICLQDSGEYIGNIHLGNIANGTAELHIFIGDVKHWGKDRAFEAISLLLEFGFHELKLDAVHIDVVKNHHASHSIGKRAGFVEQEKYFHEGLKTELVRSVLTREMYKIKEHQIPKIIQNPGLIQKGLGFVYFLIEEPAYIFSDLIAQAS
jgi:RimJ/RimL family protein N-acetyltransferase